MKLSSSRRPLASAAVLATSVAAALGAVTTSAQASAGGAANSPLTISNGTDVLLVNGHSVPFSSTVTDAAWSPDGSRVAYIDGNGNLVTANASGADVIALTKSAAGTVRSHPTWEDGGAEIIFAEQVNGGASKLMDVDVSAISDGATNTQEEPVGETASDPSPDSAPDAVFSSTPQLNLSKLVYEHSIGATHQVWILDRNTRGPAGTLLTDGSQPSVSPDGSKVAFIDTSGQVETVAIPIPVVNNVPAPVFTHVTNVASQHFAHPTWSPDGTTIAVEGTTLADAGKDVETVAATGGTPSVVSPNPGVPAYEPLNKHHVDRIAGSDRLGTAIAASQAVYRTAGSNDDPRTNTAQNVILTREDEFADALGGSALASYTDSPLLLTPTAGLDASVKNEIVRVLGAPDAQNMQTVFLLGGTQALSPTVQAEVARLGYKVVRLGDTDRFGTSVKIADYVTTQSDGSIRLPSKIMVATGLGYADALSAGAAAQGGVVVLTNGNVMPAATNAFLNRFSHNGSSGSVAVVAIGGPADTALRSVGYSTASTAVKQYLPVYGGDRYATSLAVATTFFDGPNKVGFATSLNWADALSGGAMMSHLNGPLLLVDPVNGPNAAETTWLEHTGPTLDTAAIFGGKSAVSLTVDGQIGTAMSGPAGFDQTTNPQNLTVSFF